MQDTIAAISTALGVGAISIIRVSGEDSIAQVNKIFKNKDLTKVDSHTINYGFIVDGEEKIDEVLVSIMKAPKTFTAEDVVEINCHGGIATTNKILEVLLKNGVRLAEPGEFTKRAFLNGRIDLVEAESIMDLIEVKTDKARKVAINSLGGNVSSLIRKFRQKMLELLATIEVNIDYPEYEDIEVMTNEKILNPLISMKDELSVIIKKSENTKIIKNGIKAVISGRPNVGKSSILNRLLNEEKAIVTDIEGTTRDIVEGTINLNGILLNIVDTAGIRETDNIVEQIGVKKSLNLINDADLNIVVLNNNEELTDEDLKILGKVNKKNSIVVINKVDLSSKIDMNKLEDFIIVKTNTIDDDGIESLKEKIIELFNLENLEENDYNYLSNVRQIALSKEALLAIDDAINSVKTEVPIDLVELDIKKAWEKLGEIIGENYSEELLDQLFSQFCLGK